MNDENNTIYFQSYADLEVHEKMLNDIPRNEAYRNAVFSNREYFKDKIVLDVGAGTGILSIFCAQAGAAKVYAVEASNVASLATAIINENGVKDIVEVIESRVEDLELPCKVDIIISEWMGFYLFHEGMLDSVLLARDKFLKTNGFLFPDRCKLYAAPCTLPSLHSRWEDVNGVKMNSFASALRKSYSNRPKVMKLESKNLLTNGKCVLETELKNTTVEELRNIGYQLFCSSDFDSLYQGICIWFVVSFPSLDETRSEEITLSTAPDHPTTHWKQTVLVLPQELEVEKGDPIFGILSLRKSDGNPRFYDIEFEIVDPEEEDHPINCDCSFTKCKIIKALCDQYDERSEPIHSIE